MTGSLLECLRCIVQERCPTTQSASPDMPPLAAMVAEITMSDQIHEFRGTAPPCAEDHAVQSKIVRGGGSGVPGDMQHLGCSPWSAIIRNATTLLISGQRAWQAGRYHSLLSRTMEEATHFTLCRVRLLGIVKAPYRA